MKNPKTVYVLLESQINQVLASINREMEFRNHDRKAIIFFNELKIKLDEMLSFLNRNPSIEARNLAIIINELFKKDKSIHIMNIQLVFVEGFNAGNCSTQRVNMFKK